MCQQLKEKQNEIRLTVNNEKVTLPAGTTVMKLLEMRDVKTRSSVWINGTQLLLAEYADRILCEADTVKILRVVAGG